MLGKYLRRPGADEVTLETAGLFTGANTLQSHRDGSRLSASAREQARKIEKVLKQGGGLIDPSAKSFLIKAHGALTELHKLPGALIDTDATVVLPDGMIATVQKPNPEWKAKFDELSGALADQAEAVVSKTTSVTTANHWGRQLASESAVSRFFSSFLRDPTPNNVALEAAGYVLGTKQLQTLADGTGADASAAKIARRIQNVLESSHKTMDPSARQFLDFARNAFMHLGETKSSVPTDEVAGYGEAMVRIHKPNPEWTRKLEHIQSRLEVQARVVSRRIDAEAFNIDQKLATNAATPSAAGMAP
ncbi:MAG: hypothetical protein AAF556_05995 [Pseudomonadota bacterium]